MLGARYYLAFSPEATAQADADADLTLVAVTGKWRAYEVRGSDIVAPLVNQPAVITGGGKGEREWMGVMADWYQDFGAHDVFLAASGPKEWQRVKVNHVATDSITIGADVQVDPPQRQPLDAVQVSGIRTRDNRITFDVDRPGVPVLVKASYFPNWKVSGASGPYRVSPNLMVVIPRSTHVSLYYGRTPVDVIGWILSLTGIGLAVRWARRGPVPVDDGDETDDGLPDDDLADDGSSDEGLGGLTADPGGGGDDPVDDGVGGRPVRVPSGRAERPPGPSGAAPAEHEPVPVSDRGG
jgi:hypothetical protein